MIPFEEFENKIKVVVPASALRQSYEIFCGMDADAVTRAKKGNPDFVNLAKIVFGHVSSNITARCSMLASILDAAVPKPSRPVSADNLSQAGKSLIERFSRVLPVCPECSAKMMAYNVCRVKGKQNLKGYRHRFECVRCGFEKYGFEHFTKVVAGLETQRIKATK